jgi:hypothetical protein
MRSVITAGLTALLACTLQCCQAVEKTNSDIAVAAHPDRSVATTQSERNLRLRNQARTYASRLDQGRCDLARERSEFETALTAVESHLPALRNADAGTPVINDAQLAAEAEQALAEARLDVADAARTGGCSDIANSHYKAVVHAFRGPTFAKYRQRAEMGLSALQL